jgi:hypothetical protein
MEPPNIRKASTIPINQEVIHQLRCPLDYFKLYTPVKCSVETLVTARPWESEIFFSMALFPTIIKFNTNETTVTVVRPYAACYASFRPSDSSISHHATWKPYRITTADASDVTISIDSSLVNDSNSTMSIIAACNLCNPKSGSYFWIMPMDIETAETGIDSIGLYTWRRKHESQPTYENILTEIAFTVVWD